MTPVPAAIARPLIEGLRNEVVVRDAKARALFPEIVPVPYARAVRAALASFDAASVETAWSDALTSSLAKSEPVVLATEQGVLVERRQVIVDVAPGHAFDVCASLGGATGWLRMNWAWRLRGRIDRLVGGVGMRRGRRHPHDLRVGDAVDFWRVEAVEPGRLVRLRAEMKVPGRAWLEFKTDDAGGGRARITQTAFFDPHGLLGVLYWYSLYPIHGLIFGGMIREIGRRAEAAARAHTAGPHGSRAPTRTS